MRQIAEKAAGASSGTKQENGGAVTPALAKNVGKQMRGATAVRPAPSQQYKTFATALDQNGDNHERWELIPFVPAVGMRIELGGAYWNVARVSWSINPEGASLADGFLEVDVIHTDGPRAAAFMESSGWKNQDAHLRAPRETGATVDPKERQWPSMVTKSTEAALILIVGIYEKAADDRFLDSVAQFGGLRDMIEHHPELRFCYEALSGIVEGGRTLNKLMAQVRYEL